MLDEALALDAADRVRWLDTLPSEFTPLAPVLRQLLSPSRSAKGHSLLDHLPRLREAEPSTMQATADELIGPYRLLREIGAGGMGVVWLAERADGAFKRQVALKLPRLAWAPSLAERLRRERDILAVLERGRYEEAISVLTDTLTAEKGRAEPAREQGKPKLRPTYPWEQQVHARAHARALCSGGQPQQGAAVLEKFIASRVARNHPASPWLAADRAHLGLCPAETRGA